MSSYDPDTWTCSSNEALKVFIADNEGAVSFQPTFTYPVFGDSEQIFGYKGLSIKVVFHHSTFLPLLTVKYAEKLEEGADEVVEKLLEFLPKSTIVDNEQLWIDTFTKEEEHLSYEGAQVIHKYTKGKDDYTVYKFKFDNDFAVELNKRLQILVILFIEAGSYIDTDDELWDLFVLVRDKTICGFTTSYSYFKYNGGQEFDLFDTIKRRNKISQFVILPNHQNCSHGSQLYSSIVSYWAADPTVEEICVEDPNEKFDDLRYRNDFKNLFEAGVISKLPLNLNTVNSEWFKKHAAEHKLELNQFKKVIEMGYLYNGNVKLARLIIKKRIFEKNKEGLLEMEIPVRNGKLQTAYESIKQEYMRIIDSLRLRDEDTHVAKKQRVE
jgi:histone acetyltransferase 1